MLLSLYIKLEASSLRGAKRRGNPVKSTIAEQFNSLIKIRNSWNEVGGVHNTLFTLQPKNFISRNCSFKMNKLFIELLRNS